MDDILGLLILVLLLVGVPTVIIFVIYFTYKTHLRLKEIGLERSEAIIRELDNLGEDILGCIRVERPSPGITKRSFFNEVLIITPNKLIVTRIAEIEPSEYGPDVNYISKTDEILLSEILHIEINKFMKALRLDIKTSHGDYSWYAHGFIPEKKGMKLEDYENMLRPVFKEKLHIKEGFFKPIIFGGTKEEIEDIYKMNAKERRRKYFIFSIGIILFVVGYFIGASSEPRSNSIILAGALVIIGMLMITSVIKAVLEKGLEWIYSRVTR